MSSRVLLTWQEKLGTIAQRDSYVLEHEMWTDCTFMVGPEGSQKEFKCHRLPMAKSSPVFAAMLYGDLASKEDDHVIHVPDISPRAFAALLKYIYVGELQLKDYDEVFELLYAAKKYLLHHSVEDECRAYLWQHLYPKNVWRGLEMAKQNDEEKLQETAWKVIQLETSEVLKLADFEEVPQETVLALVQGDELSCTEIEVYEAVTRWTEKEVGRQGLEMDSTNLRNILGPFLPYIRFLSMSHVEFANGPGVSETFTQNERFEIMLHKIGNENISIPTGFCNNALKRNVPDFNDFFVHGNNSKSDKIYKAASTFNLFSTTTYEIEYSDMDIYHSGVVIPTQNRESDNSDKTYMENLTIYLYTTDEKKLIEKIQFNKEVDYNSTVEIMFDNKTIDLEDIACCVKIIFHKSGHYPTLKCPSNGNLKPANRDNTFRSYHIYRYVSSETFKFLHYLIISAHKNYTTISTSNKIHCNEVICFISI